MTLKSIWISLVLSPTLLLNGQAIASAIECAPESKDLEWYVCVTNDVDYKKGIKTVSRVECTINEKLDIKGCDIGNIYSHLPKGVDPSKFQDSHNAYIYAIGPRWSDKKKEVLMDDHLKTHFEIQRESASENCNLATHYFKLGYATKFTDNFEEYVMDSTKSYDAKLKEQGKALLFSVLIPGFHHKQCSQAKSVMGSADKKTGSKFFVYSDTTYPKF